MKTTIPDESDEVIIPPESTEAAVRDANERLQDELEVVTVERDRLREENDLVVESLGLLENWIAGFKEATERTLGEMEDKVCELRQSLGDKS